MSYETKRVQTMRALVHGHVKDPTVRDAIERELTRVSDVQKIRHAERKPLLAVLHMTRALDTTSRQVLDWSCPR